MKTLIKKMNATKLSDLLKETKKIHIKVLLLIDSNSYFRIIPSYDLRILYDRKRLSEVT